MAFDDLSAIRKKVRRLTRSPAESQLTTAEIDDYINTFLVYDFPQRIQTINLRRNLALFTEQAQERYANTAITMSRDSNTSTPRSIGPGLDFDNDITFIDKPIYIAGRQAYVTQSREDFYNIYPHTNEIRDTGLRGDGIQKAFSGYLTGTPLQDDVAILPRSVTITVEAAGVGTLAIYDDGNGGLDGAVATTTSKINYNTGFFDITEFVTAPNNGAVITAEFVRERLTRPDTVLLYNNTMYVRPLPDKAYRIEFEAQVRPVRLLEANDETEIRQWWQYVAYGAAKKVFEDRMDMESVALIQPEMDTQERLALRSTLLQAKKERAGTIYASAYEGHGHGHDGVM